MKGACENSWTEGEDLKQCIGLHLDNMLVERRPECSNSPYRQPELDFWTELRS